VLFREADVMPDAALADLRQVGRERRDRAVHRADEALARPVAASDFV
jgi:hypothetical protein